MTTTYAAGTMCHECPFRAKAPPGWLGPWTVEDIQEMTHRNEVHLICHTRLEEEQHCVGALRYMNSVCRLSRDPERAAAQRALKAIPDQPLIPPGKFQEHHTQSIREFVDKQEGESDEGNTT